MRLIAIAKALISTRPWSLVISACLLVGIAVHASGFLLIALGHESLGVGLLLPIGILLSAAPKAMRDALSDQAFFLLSSGIGVLFWTTVALVAYACAVASVRVASRLPA